MRSEPFITLTCDNCGHEEEVQLHWRSDDIDVRGADWYTDGNDDFCCPECVWENSSLVTCDNCSEPAKIDPETILDGRPDDEEELLIKGWVLVQDKRFCSVECASEHYGDMYELMELVGEVYG